ncbi:unnamed protein product [Clavelina lepadiformis]|uniref:LEM domain-containing protein n=1 Tax=Clavelina lepadiformis TaxID=159417 RepID=A0ABP0GZU1_CLALP
MTEIPESIAKLTNDELRKQLIKVGIQPVPLTPTTKKLYQKKLAGRLGTLTFSEKDPSKEKYDGLQEKTSAELSSHALVKYGTENEENSGDKTAEKKGKIFYAVQVSSNENLFSVEQLIFDDKQSALSFLMKNKDARFKRFLDRNEAKDFVKQPPLVCKGDDQTTTESKAVGSEKPNNFKALKQTDLTKLAQCIEKNDVELFNTFVWGNPRYLISAGDAPVLLKPNVRYNALHIASKFNRPNIVEKLLAILQEPAFHELMYASNSACTKVDENILTQRIDRIVDLYLNTPEKGFYETPLHIACKFGFVDVVIELSSHPLCCKTMKNKFDQTPSDVICGRRKDPSAKSQIESFFRDQYFVPLVRSHDNSMPPSVGKLLTTGDISHGSLDLPRDSDDPTAPVLVVNALAGPMASQEAKEMQRSWTTPDKKGICGRRFRDIRRSDVDRGEERIGRELAKKAQIPWLEYWDFLQNFADFTTDDGLTQLETYLIKQTERKYSPPSSDIEVSVFESSDDSLKELCSQMGDVSVDENVSKTGTTCKHYDNIAKEHESVTKSRGLYSVTSTPTNTRTPHTPLMENKTSPNNVTSKEKQLFFLRETLIKVRKEQMFRLSENLSTGNSTETSTRHHPNMTPPLQKMSSSYISVNAPVSNSDVTGDLSSKISDLACNEKESSSDNGSIRSLPKSSEGSSDDSSDLKRLLPAFNHSGNTTTPLTQYSNDNFHSKLTVYLTGDEPSKIDRDVILAISDTEISAAKYPHVWTWMKSVLSYSEDDRLKWSTPKSTIRRGVSSFPTPLGTPLKFAWPASPLAKTRHTPLKSLQNTELF